MKERHQKYKKYSVLLFFPLLCLLFFSCEKVEIGIENKNDDSSQESFILSENCFAKVDSTEWVYAIPEEAVVSYTGIEAVKRRAQQMALITWRPKGKFIPSRYGVYAAGILYTGIPYSLAIKTDTYVGTQTSLYSFATAVDNPSSVLYTEDLRHSPYYGFDCAPYYGSTCSNSVMYALGIEAPYYTYMIPAIKGMKRPKGQSSEDVESCDVLLSSDHVVMVYTVNRDTEGKLQRVRIFETTSDQGHDTWFRDFTADEFKNWLEKGKYIRYQYDYLSDVTYTSSPLVPISGETGIANYYPLDICTTLGDGVTYWKGDDVSIFVSAKGYRAIAVFKDEELLEVVRIRGTVTVLTDLPCGKYKARLCDSDGFVGSHFTRFEVIDATVSGCKGATIRINFASNEASPRYVCICDGDHNPYSYYSISDADRDRGYYEMQALQGERSSYYKVYFKGKYNIISTKLKAF